MRPTKNGEIIDPMANAPYASPTWPPSNFSALSRYAAMLAYHDPQMKYWRNMNAASWTFSPVWSGAPGGGSYGRTARGAAESRGTWDMGGGLLPRALSPDPRRMIQESSAAPAPSG